mmetsp:Transcript_2194/g.3417  ORF Transcript_2194/g.3417 Transcript_2194/m.3417 type:complete len:601 (-) Transcript_2194:1-1803(-)
MEKRRKEIYLVVGGCSIVVGILWRSFLKEKKKKCLLKVYFGASLEGRGEMVSHCLKRMDGLKESYVPKVVGGLAQTCMMASRMSWLSGGSVLRPWYVEYIKLSDGGNCAINWWSSRRHCTEVALVLPGVGNCAETGFVRKLVGSLDAAGFDAACVDIRPTQGPNAENSRSLHSWQDLEDILDHVDGTIYLVGQSLGGACVLSHLGQRRCQRVAAAIIISAPCDAKKAMPQGIASLFIASAIKIQALLSPTFWLSIFLDLAPKTLRNKLKKWLITNHSTDHSNDGLLESISSPGHLANAQIRKRCFAQAESYEEYFSTNYVQQADTLPSTPPPPPPQNEIFLDDISSRELVLPSKTFNTPMRANQKQSKYKKKHQTKRPHGQGKIFLSKFLFATSVEQINEATVCRYLGYDNHDTFLLAHNPRHNLSAIQCPTLVLHALDDPIVPPPDPSLFIDSQNSNLVLVLTNTGGHLAFIDDYGHSYADTLALQFLTSIRDKLLANSVSDVVRNHATPPKPNSRIIRRFHSQRANPVPDSPSSVATTSRSVSTSFDRSASNNNVFPLKKPTLLKRRSSQQETFVAYSGDNSPRLVRTPSLRGIILGF